MRNYPGLSETQRQEIAEGLCRVMADTFALYFKTHAFHWNVEGPQFYGLHNLFETQYTEMWKALDDIAERIRALGHPAPGSYTQLKRLTVVEEQTSVSSASEMITELVQGHELATGTIRSVLATAQDAKDEASVGILASRLEAHEKAAWMLASVTA